MSDAVQNRSPSGDRAYDPDRGLGWVIFAGCMLCLVGTLNIIYGIAAISNSKFYVANTQYVFSDLKTWGWILLIVGVIQFVAAFGIWASTEWARWLGVASAGINAVVQMLFIPAYPFLSLALFATDLLVIYGLIAYGGRQNAAD
jgi:uncharacterized membrane protein (DUF2068 family)